MEISEITLLSIEILKKEIEPAEIKVVNKEMIILNGKLGITINISINKIFSSFSKNVFLPYEISESILYNGDIGNKIGYDYLMFLINIYFRD